MNNNEYLLFIVYGHQLWTYNNSKWNDANKIWLFLMATI